MDLKWRILALAIGGFAIGTGEFVPMGLLPEIAESVQVSIPEAGHLISAYAIGVVIGAPLLAVFGAHLPRRRFLVGLALALLAGNLLSAIAPGYWTLMGARFLAGLPHGAYFGVASLVGASIAGEGRRAWAVTRMMLGLSVANVIGVPFAAWLGQNYGWRAAFLSIVVVNALNVAALMSVLGPVPDGDRTSPRGELAALKSLQVWLTLGIGAIGFGGVFALYSYISPVLTNEAGLEASFVPIALVVFGSGMVAGNLFWGRWIDRDVIGSMVILLVLMGIFLAGFAIASRHGYLALVPLFLVGSATALASATQTRLMDVAGKAQTMAAALNHSSFNTGNALGALLGGIVISAGWGWTAPSWVGVGLALAGLAILLVSIGVHRRDTAATSSRAEF
ncbi:MAG: MFS transporter [Thermoleophilaceae bacterium]|nr:MFS transporter [Thermoleophilaceae bacterium]